MVLSASLNITVFLILWNHGHIPGCLFFYHFFFLLHLLLLLGFTLFYGTRCLAWSWLMFWPDCTFFTTIMKAHPINQDAVSVRWQLWGEFLKLQWILLWSIPFIVLLVTLLTSFFNVFCTSPVSTDSYSAMLTNMLTNPTSPMFYCLPSTYLSNPIFFYKYWPKSCTTPACSYLVITTIQPRTS